MKQNISIYEFDNYRAFLRTWVKMKGREGRGEWGRIAKALRVTSTMISQVIREERHLSAELASELCDYIGFSEDEARHFLLLIELGRAGSTGLKRRLKLQVSESQAKASKLAVRLKSDEAMTDAAKAQFYSDWIFSGVRNVTALEKSQSIDDLAKRFGISRIAMVEIVRFLVENRLCVSDSGYVSVGPAKTHVAADSPFVTSHHRNWRLRGIEAMREKRKEDLFYTGPMSLSEDLAKLVRMRIPSFLEDLYKDLGPSKSEVVRCLNIDWFEY